MERLANDGSAQLEWVQPRAGERHYELRDGERVYGMLDFQSAFGTLATATTSDGAWTFKRIGFLNPRVTVRLAGQGADLAVYQPRFWGDGMVHMADGRTFGWRPVNFWATEWVFSTVGGTSLVRFTPRHTRPKLADIFKHQAAIELHPEAGDQDLVPLLAALGFSLIILYQQDAAGAVAASTATTAAT